MTELNKIVSDFFFIQEPGDDYKITLIGNINIKPGLKDFINLLLHESAYEIYIPAEERIKSIIQQSATNFNENFSCFPKVVKVIDNNFIIKKKVYNYFKPFEEETKNESTFWALRDFLYKLVLGSKYKSAIDFPSLKDVGQQLNNLNKIVKDEEVKYRISKIGGLYNLYNTQVKSEGFRIEAAVTEQPIYNRIMDLLSEDLIKEYSSNKFLLGVPDKILFAKERIKKLWRDKIRTKTYLKYFNTVSSLSNVVLSLSGTQLKFPNLPEINIEKYNPPIINLEDTKFDACLSVFPKKVAIYKERNAVKVKKII